MITEVETINQTPCLSLASENKSETSKLVPIDALIDDKWREKKHLLQQIVRQVIVLEQFYKKTLNLIFTTYCYS